MAGDEQERRRGAIDEVLPDVVGFSYLQAKAKKKWRPTTMAPLPLPAVTPTPSAAPLLPRHFDGGANDDAPAQSLRPSSPPSIGGEVACPLCAARAASPCRRKDGSPAPGFHPQRVAAAVVERERQQVRERAARADVDVDAAPAEPVAPGPGRYAVGCEPFGFNRDGSVNDDEQAAILRAVAMERQGMTHEAIATRLTLEGVTRRDGRPMTAHKIGKALSRQR